MMTQNATITKMDFTNNTLYATATPTTAPTVTSLVDKGIAMRFAMKSDSAAEPMIIQTISSVMTDSGIIPELIVLTTSPPPITEPAKIPTAQKLSA